MRAYSEKLKFEKGLAQKDREIVNSGGLAVCKFLQPRDGGLETLPGYEKFVSEQLTSSVFPFPQVFVLSDVTLVCTAAKIFEYANPSRTELFAEVFSTDLSLTTWTVADFGAFLLLSNGAVVVQKDPESKSYYEIEEFDLVPRSSVYAEFNGQVIAGGVDNDWKPFFIETPFVPQQISEVTQPFTREILTDVAEFVSAVNSSFWEPAPVVVSEPTLPQPQGVPTYPVVPTPLFTLSATAAFVIPEDISGGTVYFERAVQYRQTVYLVIKGTTAGKTKLYLLGYNLTTATWTVLDSATFSINFAVSAFSVFLDSAAHKLYVRGAYDFSAPTVIHTLDNGVLAIPSCADASVITTAKQASYSYSGESIHCRWFIGVTTTPFCILETLDDIPAGNIPYRESAFPGGSIAAAGSALETTILAANKASYGVGGTQFFPYADEANKRESWAGVLRCQIDYIYYGNPYNRPVNLYFVFDLGGGNKGICRAPTTGFDANPVVDAGHVDLGVDYGAAFVNINKIGAGLVAAAPSDATGIPVEAYTIVNSGDELIGHRYWTLKTMCAYGAAVGDKVISETIITGGLIQFAKIIDLSTELFLDGLGVAGSTPYKYDSVGIGQTCYYVETDYSAFKKVNFTNSDVPTTLALPPCLVSGVNSGVALATDGSYVYMIGGKKPDGTLSDMAHKYNPSLNSWVALSNLPVALCQGCLVFLNGSLFYLGGKTADGNVNRKIYKSKFSSNTWIEFGDPLSLAMATRITENSGLATTTHQIFLTNGTDERFDVITLT